MAAVGEARDDRLRSATRLEIAIPVREANHGCGVGDIDELRVTARRVEGDAEWPLEVAGEDFAALRFRRAVHRLHDADLPGTALSDEDIAVGRYAYDARGLQPTGDPLDGDPWRHFQHCPARRLDNPGRIAGRPACIGRRPLGQGQAPT